MNLSLAKYKDLALKVIYYTKRRQLGTKIFLAKSRFQEVLLYFERNLKDPQTFLKSCYFLNGKQIFPNDILLYFCTVDPNLRLVEEDLFVEIEELEHIDDSSEPIHEKLLKPLINPFQLIILNIKEGILQKVDFPKEKLKEFGFDSLVNNNYASCNSLDSLYISYGKNFWIISNKNFAIEKKEMPISKEKHSMNYIITNNTIFIAGGNNEDSFYYDINSKEFILWGKMNGIQEKPALIQYGDFLYSFNSFSPAGIYFERTKLTSPAKKWEKLIPQSGDQESGFFYNKLYGVSKCSGGNILFAGGINNQLRTFVYNLKLNVLYININKDESILLNERTFYKIDHNFNIAITQNIEKDHIIAIINKNAKSLNLLPFEQIGNKTRNKLLQFDNPRNRLPGNLIIQCRYMSLKDYENFLKQREEQKNKINEMGKKDNKKFGNKAEQFKSQFRNKTPLALERISEGKSEEENDESEFSRNKSSSAKKKKIKLDLGLDDDLQKLKLFNKKEDKKDKENIEKKQDKTNKEKDKEKMDDNNKEEQNDNINKNENKEKEENGSKDINQEKKEEKKDNKNTGLAHSEQISRSHKILQNVKNEEKIVNKSKDGSKKNIKSANVSYTNDTYQIQNNSENSSQKNINDSNNKNEIKSENKEKILKTTNINNNTKPNIPIKKSSNSNTNTSQATNTNKTESTNTQQSNNKMNNSNTNTEQRKIVNIQRTNNTNVNNNQKPSQIQTNQNKKNNITYISSSSSQRGQQNSNNPFIDNSKYQNISEKETFHLKGKSENFLNNTNKTTSSVQQRRNITTQNPNTNLVENRVLTEPNINNNVKVSSYKSNTFAQSKSDNNQDEKKIKKTNSFKIKINLNQEPKKNPQTQKTKININLNNTNTNSNENNTNVINNNNNTSIRIIKTGSNQQSSTSNNNEMNKEGKRYNLTRNVQRIRKEDENQKKANNINEGAK